MKSSGTRAAAACLCVSALLGFAFPLQAQGEPVAASETASAAQASVALPASRALEGVWENSERFVHFSEAGMRIVLKPYYGFVWEDTGFIPAVVTGEGGIHTLTVGYPREKKASSIPVAVCGEGLYLAFLTRVEPVASSSNDATTLAESGAQPLDGFWLAGGNSDGILLYRQEAKDELFAYWFAGSSYCRIRYWAADVLKKDIQAVFTMPDGTEASVPKFLEIGGILYTCITSTGRILRNYERGTFSADGGALRFKPEVVAFAATAAAVYEPVPFAFSEDGNTLALGKPYLTRSPITDLDAEIAAHNGKRRPPRKPVFGYMELDFRWDEVDRIRGDEAPEPFDPESWVIEKPKP